MNGRGKAPGSRVSKTLVPQRGIRDGTREAARIEWSLTLAFVLAFSPLAASAENMVRYGKPVFHNGHRVLFHGAWRGGKSSSAHTSKDDGDDEDNAKSTRAKSFSPSAHEFIILVDTDDACAARMASELAAALRGAGVNARDWAGKVSPIALSRYVAGDGGDLAIAPMDALEADDKSADWHAKAPYVARLANEPIEIIAAAGVTDVNQLAGRPVSFGAADSAADASAQALFARLGVEPKPVRESLQASLANLASGKVDAIVAVGADESKAVADMARSGKYHIVPIAWSPKLRGAYAPARLTAKEQPGLITGDASVDTVAVPMALIALDAAAGTSRAAQDGVLVTALFGKYDALLGPTNDPRWREVNLAAAVDWPQLTAAQEWITAHRATGDASLEAFRTTAQAVRASGDSAGAPDVDKLYQNLLQPRGTGQ